MVDTLLTRCEHSIYFQFSGTEDVTSGNHPNPEGKPQPNPTGKIHKFESGKGYQLHGGERDCVDLEPSCQSIMEQKLNDR